MPRYHKVYSNFSGGAISERMLLHYNDPYYQNSAAKIENFTLTAQGNIKKKDGTRVLSHLSDFPNYNSEAKSKIVIYNGYAYVFDIKFNSAGASLNQLEYRGHKLGSAPIIETTNTLVVGNTVNSTNVQNAQAAIAETNADIDELNQSISTLGSQIGTCISEVKSHYNYNSWCDEFDGGIGQKPKPTSAFCGGTGSNPCGYQYGVIGSQPNLVFGNNQLFLNQISSAQDQLVIEQAKLVTQEATLAGYLAEAEIDAGLVVTPLKYVDTDTLNGFEYIENPDGSGLYIITNTNIIKITQTSNPLILTAKAYPTTEFQEPPTVGAFYQGRFWLSGFKTQQNKIVASRAGDFEDFKISLPDGNQVKAAIDGLNNIVDKYVYENESQLATRLSELSSEIQSEFPLIALVNPTPGDQDSIQTYITNKSKNYANQEIIDILDDIGTPNPYLAINADDNIGRAIAELTVVGAVDDDDPISFNLDYAEDIRWLIGGKALHCGHKSGVSSIVSDTVITPTNAFLKEQFRIPISYVKPKKFNGGFIFAPEDNNGLYFAVYSREAQSFVTSFISYKASDFIKNIVEIHSYQEDGERICLLLKDGTQAHYTFNYKGSDGGWVHYNASSMDSIAYDPDNESAQYSSHSFDNKLVISISDPTVHLDLVTTWPTNPYGTAQGDAVFFIDNTSGSKDITANISIWGKLYSESVDGVSILGGNGELIGSITQKQIKANVDIVIGKWNNDDDPIFSVVIGIPYDSKLVTLPSIGLNNENSLLDLRKNYEIAVRFNGDYPLVNKAKTFVVDPMTPSSFVTDGTETTKLKFIGFTEDNSITVESKYPYPLEIFGLSFKGVSND